MITYPLLIGFAASLGLAWVAWREAQVARREILDAGLLSLFGGLIGARLGYVIFNWSYFQAHPLESIQMHLGGLSWFGALVGSLIALAIFTRATSKSFPALADALLPLATILATAAWLGSWPAGIAYGPVSDAWWALPAPDEWGVISPRLPVPLFGELAAILLFWLVDSRRARWSDPGQIACIWLLGYALSFFALTYLRVDPMPILYGLRIDAWAALLTAAFSLLGLYIIIKSHDKQRIGDIVTQSQETSSVP